MTTGKICVMIILCYSTISGMIGLYLSETCDDKISDCKKAFCAICWPLVIVLLPVFYIIKHNKLKEINKIEENKRKKELVDNVLKELNIR